MQQGLNLYYLNQYLKWNKRKRPPILLAIALLLSTAKAILTGEVTVTPTTVSSTAQLLFEMVASE